MKGTQTLLAFGICILGMIGLVSFFDIHKFRRHVGLVKDAPLKESGNETGQKPTLDGHLKDLIEKMNKIENQIKSLNEAFEKIKPPTRENTKNIETMLKDNSNETKNKESKIKILELTEEEKEKEKERKLKDKERKRDEKQWKEADRRKEEESRKDVQGQVSSQKISLSSEGDNLDPKDSKMAIIIKSKHNDVNKSKVGKEGEVDSKTKNDVEIHFFHHEKKEKDGSDLSKNKKVDNQPKLPIPPKITPIQNQNSSPFFNFGNDSFFDKPEDLISKFKLFPVFKDEKKSFSDLRFPEAKSLRRIKMRQTRAFDPNREKQVVPSHEFDPFNIFNGFNTLIDKKLKQNRKLNESKKQPKSSISPLIIQKESSISSVSPSITEIQPNKIDEPKEKVKIVKSEISELITPTDLITKENKDIEKEKSGPSLKPPVNLESLLISGDSAKPKEKHPIFSENDGFIPITNQVQPVLNAETNIYNEENQKIQPAVPPTIPGLPPIIPPTPGKEESYDFESSVLSKGGSFKSLEDPLSLALSSFPLNTEPKTIEEQKHTSSALLSQSSDVVNEPDEKQTPSSPFSLLSDKKTDEKPQQPELSLLTAIERQKETAGNSSYSLVSESKPFKDNNQVDISSSSKKETGDKSESQTLYSSPKMISLSLRKKNRNNEKALSLNDKKQVASKAPQTNNDENQGFFDNESSSSNKNF